MNCCIALDIGFHYNILVVALHYFVKKMVSATAHQNNLLAKLQKEMQLDRILGPLKQLSISNLH